MSQVTAFMKFDKDDDGDLDFNEFVAFQRAKPGGKRLTEAELRQKFAAMDKDQDGQLEMDEFMTYNGGMENGQMHGKGMASYPGD